MSVRRTCVNYMEFLRRVLPEAKINIVQVKDGWRPLCKALGKPNPDEPFPRIIDTKSTQDPNKESVMKGWIAQADISAVAVIVLGAGLYLRLHR